MPEQIETMEQLQGTIERITYRNSQNGYTVFSLRAAAERVTAVGFLPFLAEGDVVTLQGRYVVHPTYGQQFEAESCEREMPSNAASILRYLSSGAIRGVGPATARRIVERFGDRSLEIMEQSPMALSKIRGISREKAILIGEEYKKQFGVRDVMLLLSQFHVTPEEALAIYKAFGTNATKLIRENPYALCRTQIGFSFDRAEEVARYFNIDQNDPIRLEAGMEYILRHNLGNGHTCLPVDKWFTVSCQLLGCDRHTAADICGILTEGLRVRIRNMGGVDYAFLPDLYASEEYIASRLTAMLRRKEIGFFASELEIDWVENKLSFRFETMQRQAIKEALERGLLVLTGGPGTGKSTTLRAIIQIFEEKNRKILLAAPTGRAAKRMSELTGYEAKTLHRLLEVEWGEGDKPMFARDERNPLDCDVLIVDEMSMVDAVLFEHVLRAVRLSCRLILVGDADQLPSVGAGNVLHDILESGVVPCVCLKKVFRQAMESTIIRNAHAILCGETPDLDRKDSDFFMMDLTNPYVAAKTVVDLCTRRLPDAYGFSPFADIQVLCPSKKLELGSVNLNNLLQDKLNPQERATAQVSYKGLFLRVGDKVMQVKNNYDILWTKDNGETGSGVYNGDIGILEEIDFRSGVVKVRFDDRVASYPGETYAQLELAYAVTVHKSQGSEFDCVILPLLDVPKPLRYRNLLYTAVTRAKKLLIIVGSRGVVCAMVENGRKTLRYTGLKSFLEALNDA